MLEKNTQTKPTPGNVNWLLSHLGKAPVSYMHFCDVLSYSMKQYLKLDHTDSLEPLNSPGSNSIIPYGKDGQLFQFNGRPANLLMFLHNNSEISSVEREKMDRGGLP